MSQTGNGERYTTCDWCAGTGSDSQDCEYLCVKCMGRGIYPLDFEEEQEGYLDEF